MTPQISGVQARIARITSRFQPGASFAGALAAADARSATPAAPRLPVGRTVAGAPPVATVGRATAPVPAAAPGTAAPTAPPGAPATTLDAAALPDAAGPWLGHVERAARRHGLDPRLLAALVTQESGFRADVRSPAGAIGLTQLMPPTAAELGVDPTDPLANLDGGARYLRQQLDRFGRPELALAAYNAGPGRVAASGGIPPITETQGYVRNVMAIWTRLGGGR